MDSDWNLKGCRRDDPSRFRSAEDVVRTIHEVGFLSLFATEIPGFSVEEHTFAWDWWSDRPETDPWAWRMEIAARDDIAYGKFFDRKAGFISKPWFGAFANYRRDGYDYEGMYEDGKMKHRNRQIMDALEPDDQCRGLELLSCDLKKKAAVEKGFEGALTELQMQTFLIMSDFRQRKNKYGVGYGWHVAALMTPETKWGYDRVNGCGRKPDESRERIREQILRFFPDAAEKDIGKVTGIRN